jgi:hypothetical protein
VVRKGARRDEEGKEEDQVRPLWSGKESGGTRKERNRIKGGHCVQERIQEGQGRKGTETGEATVVRRGVRKEWNRIRRDHCSQ